LHVSRGLIKRTLHWHRRRQPGRHLGRPVEGESNESTGQPGGWLGRGRGQSCVGDVVSAQRWGAGGGGAAGRKGRLSGREREEKEGRGVEDSKEGTTERIEEQRTLYTRTKRRRGALPDRGVAKPNAANHGQRSYKQRSLYRKFVVAQAPTTISPSLPLMAQSLLTMFPYQTMDGPLQEPSPMSPASHPNCPTTYL
jgi:hypothetical protein